MAFAHIKNENGIHRSADACRARELVDGIAVALLAEMMHQQKRNFEIVGKSFELSHLVIVVSVGDVNSIVANDLKGIDDDEHRVTMLRYEVFNLRAERVGKFSRGDCKAEIAGGFIGQPIETVLNTK